MTNHTREYKIIKQDNLTIHQTQKGKKYKNHT